jgi:predicted CoA-binding protein
VNPQIDPVGARYYASFRCPEKIDIANVFRSLWKNLLDQATRWKVPAIWMQEDVTDGKPRRAGMFLGMNRCIF